MYEHIPAAFLTNSLNSDVIEIDLLIGRPKTFKLNLKKFISKLDFISSYTSYLKPNKEISLSLGASLLT